jgi:hypothetical protein
MLCPRQSRRIRVAAVGVLALTPGVVAGCGSGKATGTSSAPGSSAQTGIAATSPSLIPGLASRTYRLRLLGSNEVFPRSVREASAVAGPAKPPSGAGRAVISFRAATAQACWRFAGLRGFALPTFARIHKGGRGVAGPIVIPLGSTFSVKGCVRFDPRVIAAIEASPGGYYVNIHTVKYPTGALRAQL